MGNRINITPLNEEEGKILGKFYANGDRIRIEGKQ